MTPTVDADIAAPEIGLTPLEHRYHSIGKWQGPTYEVRPRPPLRIALEHEGSDVVVREVETGIFGVGPDHWAAFRDFSVALQEHVDVLERQDVLSDALHQQLEYLRERVPTSRR